MRVSELKRFRVLQELSEEERELIEDLLGECLLADNETLFAVGDEADSLVLVDSGALLLTDESQSGSAEAGTSLGECALFSFGTRQVGAVARGATTVWILRREDFRRFIDDHPRTAFRIAEAVLCEIADRVQEVARS